MAHRPDGHRYINRRYLYEYRNGRAVRVGTARTYKDTCDFLGIAYQPEYEWTTQPAPDPNVTVGIYERPSPTGPRRATQVTIGDTVIQFLKVLTAPEAVREARRTLAYQTA